MQFLVPTRSDVTPVEHSVVDGLSPIGAVSKSQEAVADLITGCTLFDMFPITESVLVLDLDTFLACKCNRPMGCIHARQGDSTRIPLGMIPVQAIQETGN